MQQRPAYIHIQHCEQSKKNYTAPRVKGGDAPTLWKVIVGGGEKWQPITGFMTNVNCELIAWRSGSAPSQHSMYKYWRCCFLLL